MSQLTTDPAVKTNGLLTTEFAVTLLGMIGVFILVMTGKLPGEAFLGAAGMGAVYTGGRSYVKGKMAS